MTERKQQIEFGDFQTPDALALAICERLHKLGIRPDVVVEPTCGRGAFVEAAIVAFPDARQVIGFEVNERHLSDLRARTVIQAAGQKVTVKRADFFTHDWAAELSDVSGPVLVIGNFPWVTNAVQGNIGGSNLPTKSNFLKFSGLDAITGKANFDISEWMLLEVLRWFKGRSGTLAMLCKKAVARKVLSHAAAGRALIADAQMIGIDAKLHFKASVEACLLVAKFTAEADEVDYDYTIFDSLTDTVGKRVGHRSGMTVSDLETFEAHSFLVGQSPQKWRSGVKHDAAPIMELSETNRGLENGLGERVEIEPAYVYPLMKGADVGNAARGWRKKYVIVTQKRTGEDTEQIARLAPKTWAYLQSHATSLDSRTSSIYAKGPRFSVFGIGDYAFRPWKIAICGLYKNLNFRLVGPENGRPMMFDDTVYFLSFDQETEARETLRRITSPSALSLLAALIFWDEKRPIKSAILNSLDWSRLPLKAA